MPDSKAEHPSIITVTDAAPSAPLRKPWKSTIATGYAPLHLREDLQSHLAILQRTVGYRYCRFHGLFHDDMAVVARRKDGSLAFRWAQVDKVFDSLLQVGLRPHVELSTMPVALASGTTTIDDWEWNTTPPRDYAEWGQLVGAFARHCLDRYGLDEIAQWYYEVWNEPNINFWTGSQQDYWNLYDVSAAALKAVSPRLRVGGPVTAHAAWIPEMISHCATKGVPLDFISTHIYSQDEFVEYPGLRGSPHKPGMFIPDVVRRCPRDRPPIGVSEFGNKVDGVEQPGSTVRTERLPGTTTRVWITPPPRQPFAISPSRSMETVTPSAGGMPAMFLKKAACRRANFPAPTDC